MSSAIKSLLFPVLVLAAACVFAQEPAKPSDPAKPTDPVKPEDPGELDTWISQLADADATKVTLAAGALLDRSREKDLPPELRQKIRLALKSRLTTDKAAAPNVAVILKVISQKKEKFFNKDLVSLVCKGEPALFELGLEALISIGDETVQDEFMAVFKDCSNPLQSRVVALRALNHLKSWKSLPELVAATADPTPEIAAASQYSLEGILGYPFALEAAGWAKWWAENSGRTKESILYDAVEKLRAAGLSMVKQTDLEQNIKMLKSGVRGWQTRALENLTAISDPSSIPDLLAFTRSGSGAGLREPAVKLLGMLANKESALKSNLHAEIAREMVALLPKEAESRMITAIIEVLGKIRRIEGMDLVAPLIPFLASQNAQVQLYAARSLGTIGGVEAAAAVPALCDILAKTGGESGPRRESAIALGNIGSPAAIPALVQALADQDSNVRFNSANSLGQIKDEAALEPVAKALATEQEDRVLESEIKTLRVIGKPAAIAPLARLSSRKPALSEKILEAVTTIAGENLAALLAGADAFATEGRHDLGRKLIAAVVAKSPTPEHRKRYASYLGDAGSWDDCVRELLSILKTEPEDKEAQDKLLRALCQIDDPAARGARTGEAMAAFPAKADLLWEGAVRDWKNKLSAASAAFFAALAKGAEGTAAGEQIFGNLLAFVVNADGRVAAAAHEMLRAWTGQESEGLAEDAAEGVKKQAASQWEKWWAANKAKFPFSAK